MPVYVQLFHGRKAPDQDMTDWGEPGPVFVVDWFHVTYANHIRMGNDGDDNMELSLVEDMLYYDGMYYGDWSVFSDSSVEIEAFRDRFQMYDAAKAVVPVAAKCKHQPHDSDTMQSICERCQSEVFCHDGAWYTEAELTASAAPEGVVQTADEADDEVTIVLKRNDAGQVLDGIRARHEQWQKTASWFGGDHSAAEEAICDCDSLEEAQKIAAHYGKLVEQLEAQF